MAEAKIEIGEELGVFTSKAHWIDSAKRVYTKAYQQIGSKDVITLDSATPRRIMLRGLQFRNADEECTYPATVYAISGNKENGISLIEMVDGDQKPAPCNHGNIVVGHACYCHHEKMPRKCHIWRIHAEHSPAWNIHNCGHFEAATMPTE